MHTQGQAIQFIEQVFGDVQLTNQGLNANVVCPICQAKSGSPTFSKKKLAIRTDCWLLHCWSCGYKARSLIPLLTTYHPHALSNYVKAFEGTFVTNTDQDPTLNDANVITLPGGFLALCSFLGAGHRDTAVPGFVREALNYVFGRGLTERDVWYYRLGVTDQDPLYRNRVIVPSHDAEGALNFFVSRSIRSGIKPKYLSPTAPRGGVVFNALNVDWSEELTLVEGPFDLMKCNDNATCLLGKELTENHQVFQEIVKHQTPVCVALDADAIGQGLKVAGLLHQYGVSVRTYRFPPGVKDPGVMSRNAFVANLERATMFQTDDLLRHRIKQFATRPQ